MQANAGLKTVVTFAALAMAAFHIWVKAITVDAITLGLFAVAVLPWLQPILKTIKLSHEGLEITLQELKQEVENASGAAQSAERKADLAVSGLGTNAAGTQAARLPQERLLELAQRYEEIRNTQDSGPTRTQAMTEVVREMVELARVLPALDVAPMLRSSERGIRLAAYAYLYVRPDPARLVDLVQSVTAREDKPFGQYWGLQALGLNLAGMTSDKLPDAVVGNLSAYANKVPRGTDRDYEIRRILKQVGIAA